MNRLLNKILISIIVLSGIFFAPSVFAEEDFLIVEFEKSPLFSEASFLPGDTVNRWVKIWNYSETVQAIAVSPINVNNPDGLADVLYLQIKEGANILFDGTLADFFDAGEVYLSGLANGAQTQYDFYVTFDSASGEEYAGKVLGFDFEIGFQEPVSTTTFQSTTGGIGGDPGGGTNNQTSNFEPSTQILEQGTGGEETEDGQVLGAATFRTYLPETGGIIKWLLKDEGSIYSGSQAMQTNILIAGIFILAMIGLVIIRKRIKDID